MPRPGLAGWLVGGLTLLALGLRLACIGQSPFGDELYLYAIVHNNSLGEVFSIVHDTEKTPPLGFVLAWLLDHGAEGEVLVRLPSLLAGVATVPLVYLLGMRTLGRGAGVFAAAWFALSPFEIFYATESRSYAQATALVVLSTLALLIALEDRRLRWWALYVVAATAAVYAHYIAFLVLIPQAAWALWTHRGTARRQLAAHGLVFVAFLPWLPSFLTQLRHSEFEAAVIDAVAPLTGSKLVEISGKALAGHPFVSLTELFGVGALIVLALVLLAALFVRAWYLGRDRGSVTPTIATRRGLLVLLAVSPLAGIALYSLQPDTSFLLPRNLSVGVPYALLLVGWLLASPRPRLAVALSVIALGALTVGTVKMLDPDYQRPDGRGAAQYLDATATATAPVIEVSFAGFESPPAAGLRIHLVRPHEIYAATDQEAAWAVAARTHSPAFVYFYAPARLAEVIPGLPPHDPALFEPPPRYASRYDLVAERNFRGLVPIIVREYAPK